MVWRLFPNLFQNFFYIPNGIGKQEKNSPVHRSSNLEKNIGVPFKIWSKIMCGQKWNIL